MGMAGVVSALVAVSAGAPPVEVALGLAGPLLAGCVTWWLVRRTLLRAPEQLTNVMLKAFAAKMVFFGAYVVVVMRGVPLSATAFVVSFTVSFVGVYVIEALFLQRLFVGAR
jgi:hypothetical protein